MGWGYEDFSQDINRTKILKIHIFENSDFRFLRTASTLHV